MVSHFPFYSIFYPIRRALDREVLHSNSHHLAQLIDPYIFSIRLSMNPSLQSAAPAFLFSSSQSPARHCDTNSSPFFRSPNIAFRSSKFVLRSPILSLVRLLYQLQSLLARSSLQHFVLQLPIDQWEWECLASNAEMRHIHRMSTIDKALFHAKRASKAKSKKGNFKIKLIVNVLIHV